MKNTAIRRFLTCTAVLVILIALVSCSGGGGGTPPTPPPPEASTTLSTAKTQLAAGDISGARASYETVISDPATASNSEARFGRAFTDILLLIEKAPSDAILAGFGQPLWRLSNVFGASGYFAQSLVPDSAYPTLLPFYNIKNCWKNRNSKTDYRCIISRTTSGYTSSNLITSFGELTTNVDPIIADLIVAITDTAATFTVPKELYSGDANISVNHADMVQILAGMYLLKASSDLANSWTFNMDLSTLVDSSGNALVTSQQLVNLLNAQFGLRSDNRLASARTNIQSWAQYSKQALGEILAGSTGGVLNLSATNTPIYQDFYDMTNSVIESLEGNAVIADIQPDVTANLDSFFSNPPNVMESDPFILQGTKIKAVEAYWQQMINSACSFDIGTRNVKIFSDAVRAIHRPYYQLFNAIMGHRFGKYTAGRGA